jgi:hypothetical protein
MLEALDEGRIPPRRLLSRLIFDPAIVGSPAMSNRFLTANGTPASGPSGLPLARASSRARARSRARSSVTAVNELSNGARADAGERYFDDLQGL